MLLAVQRDDAIEALSRMMLDSNQATSGLLARLGDLESQLAVKLKELDALQQRRRMPSCIGHTGLGNHSGSLASTSDGVLTKSAYTHDSLPVNPSNPSVSMPHAAAPPIIHGPGVSPGGHRVAWERFAESNGTRGSPEDTTTMEEYTSMAQSGDRLVTKHLGGVGVTVGLCCNAMGPIQGGAEVTVGLYHGCATGSAM